MSTFKNIKVYNSIFTIRTIVCVAVFTLLFMQSELTNAQYNEADLDSIIDDFLETDKYLYDLLDGNTNYHFLFVNTSFANQTTFAGRAIADNLYNLSGQIYYFISNGLYFGASGIWYSQIEPGYRITSLTAGYSGGSKNLKYRGTYNRYLYNIPDYEPTLSNSVNLGSTFKMKNYGARADYSMLFGTELSHQVSIDVYSKFKILSLGKYDKIEIQPELSFYLGSETIEKDIATGDKNDPFYIPEYTQFEKFGLLNTQFQLPISIDYNDFMFEIAYYYNFPRSLDTEYNYPQSNFFRISLGYIISLN